MKALGTLQGYRLLASRCTESGEGTSVTLDDCEGDVLFVLSAGRALGAGEAAIAIETRATDDDEWAAVAALASESVEGVLARSVSVPADTISRLQVRAVYTIPAGEVFDLNVTAIANTKYPIAAAAMKGSADAIAETAKYASMTAIVNDTFSVVDDEGGDVTGGVSIGDYHPVGAMVVNAGYRCTDGSAVATVVLEHSDDDGDEDPYAAAPVDGGGLNFEGAFPTIELVTAPVATLKRWIRIRYGGTGTGDLELFVFWAWVGDA